MPSLPSIFAAEVYKARNRKGLTQEQLSSALHITTRWYQKIEKGESKPNLVTALSLLVCLDIDLQVFRKEVERHVRLPILAG